MPEYEYINEVPEELTDADLLRQSSAANNTTSEGNSNISQRQINNQRNVSNNANNVKNLANVASKSANPYAKAAGAAVKVADKLTDGKASEKIGKALNTANKLSPGGRLLQKASNKMAENGTSNRISSALSKKKSAAPAMASASMQSSAVSEGKDNSMLSRREVEDQTSDGGEINLKATAKFLKIALVASVPIFVVVIFMNLIVSASQTYLSVIGLDKADKVSDADADKAIRDNGSEGLDDEIEDEPVGYEYNDIFINDSIYNIKFNKLNFIDSTREKTNNYGPQELRDLEDYYSDINNYKDGSYNMDDVYRFFFKLLYIQKRYKRDYNVDLDMALLMSTLKLQSEDMSEIFVSNTKKYKVSTKEDNELFNYNYDWSNYKLSKNNSTNDIEVLAQRMVVRNENSSCPNTVDGKCYSISEEKYREFLKEFLEKKYFINDGQVISGNSNEGFESNEEDNNFITPGEDSKKSSMAEEMISVANKEYTATNGLKGGKKYWSSYGYSGRVEWCAIFAWYVSANTEFEGEKLYPDIINYKNASTGRYMQYFNTSTSSNIKFYHNDSCANLKGKNGSTNYIPKAGDYIFIDWAASFYGIDVSFGKQDHTGIVEKYEDGIIYTIEGNMSDTVVKRSYKIDDCRVIGFGSWY